MAAARFRDCANYWLGCQPAARALIPPDDTKLAFVRICSHYFAHGGFLEDGVLIREAGKLAGIPGILIQGRTDLAGPVITAWELAQAWRGSELVIIEGSGHTGGTAAEHALDAAADRLFTMTSEKASKA